MAEDNVSNNQLTDQKDWHKQTFLQPLQGLLTWQSLSLFWLCGLVYTRFPLVAICAASFILLLDKRLQQKARLILAIALFILGIIAIHLSIEPRPAYPKWALDGQKPAMLRLEGTITKVEGLSDQRLRMTLSNVRSLEHLSEDPLEGLMIWTWEAKKAEEARDYLQNPRPLPGQKIQISARIRTTEGFNNEVGNNYSFYMQSQGIFWRIWSRGSYGNPQISGEPTTSALIRTKGITSLTQTLFSPKIKLESIKAQAYAFLPALIFGEKYFLNQNVIEKMASASLIHSLALSGQHLAVVGLAALLFLACTYTLYPNILLILPNRTWLGLLALPLAMLYLWLGNAPPSLLRAAIMLGLTIFFHLRTRIVTLGDILLLTLLLITCYAPSSIFNLGLQLSVLCVASIVLMLPILRRIPIPSEKYQKGAPIKYFFAIKFRAILQILIISFGIQITLLPVFLYYFSPSGPWFISNIFWLPILGFWVLPMAFLGLGLTCIWPNTPFSEQVLDLAALPCELLLNILQWMQEVNLFAFPAVLRAHWTAFFAWFAICLALALLAGRVNTRKFFKYSDFNIPSGRMLILMGMLMLFAGPVLRYAKIWWHKDDVRLEMFDVGQGQAVCITLGGGDRILIDGGGFFSKRFDTGADILIPNLTNNAAPRLLAAINTHPDMDHLRGLMAVLEKMQVNTFFHNGQKFSKSYSEKILSLQNANKLLYLLALDDTMQIKLPSVDNALYFEVLNPPQKHAYSNNNASIVLRLVYENLIKQGIALFCGDIETQGLQNILQSKQNLSSDIIIVPHHGSKDALVPEFYDATHAKLALISTAKLNNFEFPHTEVQKALTSRNIATYSTSNHGNIEVIWSKTSTFNPSELGLYTPFLQINTQNQPSKLAQINILR